LAPWRTWRFAFLPHDKRQSNRAHAHAICEANCCNNGWTVRAVGDFVESRVNFGDIFHPATVPGCIHTDLLRAGKIPDPYLDLNEYKLQWIGRTDWEYRTTFDADAKLFDHERIDLVFDDWIPS